MFNDIVYIYSILIGLIFMCTITGIKLKQCQRKLDTKNITIMKYYLDNRFIFQKLLDNLYISNSSIFCTKLINDLKEYYNLQDIIVIDSIKSVVDEYRITALNSAVVEFVRRNEHQIFINKANNNLLSTTASLLESRYVLYISKLADMDENDGLVICIEAFPSLLAKHEVDSLNNCISLLKTRLFY